MITLGCDIGSLFSKAVIFDDDDLVALAMVRTTGNIADEIEDLLGMLMKKAGIKKDRIDGFAGTGSGADLLIGVDFTEDEVNCVGAAASFFIPDVELGICIGGQSISAMQLDADGLVTNFMRNDKCASGSGRFLEVMCEKLNEDISVVDALVSKATSTVPISSQCSVFAESEVITHVNEGLPLPDIFSGICTSVANIVVSQTRRFGMAPTYTIVGGVAKLESVVDIIKGKLTGEYHPFPHDPQYAAAIGAALLAGS